MKVNLDNGVEGVIWHDDTGYEYTKQSGGVSCRHPSQEGIFIPFTGIEKQMDAVHGILCTHPFGNNNYEEEDVEEVRRAVRNIRIKWKQTVSPFRLDEDNIEDTMEAWVKARTTGELTEDFHSPFHIEDHPVTLVYWNCD